MNAPDSHSTASHNKRRLPLSAFRYNKQNTLQNGYDNCMNSQKGSTLSDSNVKTTHKYTSFRVPDDEEIKEDYDFSVLSHELDMDSDSSSDNYDPFTEDKENIDPLSHDEFLNSS